MKTQIVTFTPPSAMTEGAALEHIGSLLPSDVVVFLGLNQQHGNWSRTITESNGTFTITNTFTDEVAAEYTSLMAGVSEGVKSQLTSDGWTISFNPETADL